MPERESSVWAFTAPMRSRPRARAAAIFLLKCRVYQVIKGKKARITRAMGQLSHSRIAAAPINLMTFTTRSSGTWWKNSARARESLVMRDIRSPTVWLS